MVKDQTAATQEADPPEAVPGPDPIPEALEVMPTNVIGAIAWVMANMGGIRKMSAADRQAAGMGGGDRGVSYAYRGIDQIAAAAQRLMGEAGVVIVPRILSRDTVDITVAGNPWTDTFVMVSWTICGPGGLTDSIEATTEGLGRDNSDKGINKAMTGAYKNLLLRLLCIGDPQDDTDGHTNVRDRDRERQPDQDELLYARVAEFARISKEHGQALRTLGDSVKLGFTIPVFRENPDWAAKVAEFLDNVKVVGLPQVSEPVGEPVAEAEQPVDVPQLPQDEPDEVPAAEVTDEAPVELCEFCGEAIQDDATCGCAPNDGQGDGQDAP